MRVDGKSVGGYEGGRECWRLRVLEAMKVG